MSNEAYYGVQVRVILGYLHSVGNIQTVLSLSPTDTKILCLGLIQSLFEGSMYIFVLEWTPALTPKSTTTEKQESIPHGHIFAAFMVGRSDESVVSGLRIIQFFSL